MTGDFQVRNTRDLVALCSAVPGSELYVAAINFCHGYGVGAFQYYQVLEASVPGHRIFCAPEPRPSRTAVIEGFLRWASAHPEYQEEPAVESIFRYLGTTYPCPM
jgi:hypothetical protein